MDKSMLTSCFYYPTTVIFLDDSASFLKNVSVGLARTLSYVCFTDPKEALAYINNNNHAKQLINNTLLANVDSDNFGVNPQEYETKLDLSALHKQASNPQRFKEATILVVDYSMPDIDGLSFCAQLKGLPIKKIMLTGQADESIAVKAFNLGLIDRFITKKVANFGEKVNEAIADLQNKYFSEWSLPLMTNLVAQQDSCLNDPIFCKKFHEICREHEIVEFYLLDNNGNFLLLNWQGEPTWLLTATDVDLNDYYQVAEDHHAPKPIVDQLKRGEILAYFPDAKKFMEVEGEEWKKYVFPAQKLQGDHKTYYYALVKELPTFGFKQDEQMSFKKFLEKIWAPTKPK